MLPRFIAWVALLAVSAGFAGIVSGQAPSTGSGQAAPTSSGPPYPSKVIRIFAPGVGGGTDLIARMVAQAISGPLGQQVIVENRPSGVIPGEIVSQAPPDGHTILMAGNTVWIGPLLRKTPYDPIRDFLPITLTARAPNVVVVHPSLPVKSIKELIALAKAKPGALNYSTGATGASSHLAAELFKAMAGVNMVRIPYKNGAIEIADLLAGHVQLTFGAAGSVGSFIKLGKIRPVAVCSVDPSALFPGLPTISASGVPGFESESYYGLMAPAKTPPAVIRRLNEEASRYLRSADAKDKFLNISVEAAGGSPDNFGAIIKSEIVRMGKLIRDTGLRDE